MPITDNGFERLSRDEIYDRLVTAFESQFDATVEPGDLVKRQLEALADVLYENQEATLQAVYESAYLQDATGSALDKLVARLGLERREATPASGIIELLRDGLPTATYTVASGETFQTRGTDPISFETTTTAVLELFDDFANNLASWNGDVSEWTLTNHSTVGDSVEKPAIDGSSIYYTTRQFPRGTTVNLNLYAEADTTLGIQFGKQNSGDFYEAVIDEQASEIRIEVYDDGSVVSSSATAYDVPHATEIHAEVEYESGNAHRLSLYESESRDTELATVTHEDSTYQSFGDVALVSRDATANVYIERVANTSVGANIRATEGGIDTNVSANQIVLATSTLTGVDSQTNPLPTGDDAYVGVNGSAFVLGQDRETDEELRERAFASTIIGGAATKDSIESALRDIDHVDSLTLYNNRTDSTVDGLPPHSFEAALYYSGPDEDIANAIFDSMAIDSQDVGGINGTEVTYTLESDVSGDEETIHWSTIPETNLDIDLTLVVDENYVGETDIKSQIVNYVGGTDVDGAQLNGLSVGDDLYVAVLEDVVVDPDGNGVWAVDSVTIDSNGDGTDDTTELANGAVAYAVADNEVVVTNGRDGSITINTVTK